MLSIDMRNMSIFSMLHSPSLLLNKSNWQHFMYDADNTPPPPEHDLYYLKAIIGERDENSSSLGHEVTYYNPEILASLAVSEHEETRHLAHKALKAGYNYALEKFATLGFLTNPENAEHSHDICDFLTGDIFYMAKSCSPDIWENSPSFKENPSELSCKILLLHLSQPIQDKTLLARLSFDTFKTQSELDEQCLFQSAKNRLEKHYIASMQDDDVSVEMRLKMAEELPFLNLSKDSKKHNERLFMAMNTAYDICQNQKDHCVCKKAEGMYSFYQKRISSSEPVLRLTG